MFINMFITYIYNNAFSLHLIIPFLGYIYLTFSSAIKTHIKNKFKLLNKKWDKYIKRILIVGKNSSGKGAKSLPYFFLYISPILYI